MPRAATRQDLLTDSRREFDHLLHLVNEIPPEQRIEPGVNGEWTVKDVLAHLHAWHELLFGWYEVGMAGGKPAIPAEGYTWKQEPELNEKIFQQYQAIPYDEVIRQLTASFERIYTLIERHSDEELFTKQKYPWTGSTSLGSYLVSTTSSHYQWASDLIKKWKKNARKPVE